MGHFWIWPLTEKSAHHCAPYQATVPYGKPFRSKSVTSYHRLNSNRSSVIVVKFNPMIPNRCKHQCDHTHSIDAKSNRSYTFDATVYMHMYLNEVPFRSKTHSGWHILDSIYLLHSNLWCIWKQCLIMYTHSEWELRRWDMFPGAEISLYLPLLVLSYLLR